MQASAVLGDLHDALVRLHVQRYRQRESHVEYSARREMRRKLSAHGFSLATFIEKLHFYRER